MGVNPFVCYAKIKRMKQKQLPIASEEDQHFISEKGLARRRFLTQAAGIAAIPLIASLASCHKDDDDNGVDLGSGDVGILNYAYALEQLEAAFYTQVIMSPYSNITATETALLTDIRDHEIAHREFFKNALAGKAIGN